MHRRCKNTRRVLTNYSNATLIHTATHCITPAQVVEECRKIKNQLLQGQVEFRYLSANGDISPETMESLNKLQSLGHVDGEEAEEGGG